jgi:hypothetical protein
MSFSILLVIAVRHQSMASCPVSSSVSRRHPSDVNVNRLAPPPLRIMTFEVIKEDVLHEGRWIRMKNYTYSAPNGSTKTWEMVERTTRTGACDAVDMLAIVNGKERACPAIVLVKQFRPPVKGWTIEMPAGLVDPGESVAVTALRELLVPRRK